MKISKVLVGIVVTLVGIVSILGYFYIEGSYVGTVEIGVQEIEVTEECVMIKGFTLSSAKGFSNYEYFIENATIK